MATNEMEQFVCPAREAGDGEKAGWVKRMIEEGGRFVTSQPGWKEIGRIREILEGTPMRAPDGVEVPFVNFLQRNAREIVATLTNLNPRWGYTTDNPEWQAHADVLNKCFRGWWSSTFADRKIKGALQHALVASGYIMVRWNPRYWSPDRGDIELVPLAAEDVMVVMPSRDGDLQKAYAILIREEVPIAEAWNRFPEHRHRIKPSRSHASWIRRPGTGLQRVLSPFFAALGRTGSGVRKETVYPTVDLWHIYVQDYSLNTTGKPVQMGEPGSNWSYEVPSLGIDIPSGQFDSSGRPLYRRATQEDARLYPGRRRIIATEDCVLSDDTSPWWHGRVPLVRFDLHRWIWSWFGSSLISNGLGIQKAYNDLLGAVVTSAAVRIDPPMGYDDQVHSRTFMQRINLRKPGERVAVDFSNGESIRPLIPPQYYDLPPWIEQLLEKMPELINHQMGVMDMTPLMKAAQIPGDDTIEKLLQVNGPLITDYAREMERCLYEMGMLIRDLFFQFYDARRRIQILGPDGLTMEDFDYEPGSMIPARMAGEASDRPSAFSRVERARRHAQNFFFHITPNSSYAITDMSRQLMYLQLWRDQRYPIDPQTVAEAINLPNFGKAFEGTVIERWQQWNQMMMETQMQMQAEAQQMQMQAQAAASPLAAMFGGGASGPVGRPPSGSEPPRIRQVMDANGPRTVVSESG